jgi:hypothetical protein
MGRDKRSIVDSKPGSVVDSKLEESIHIARKLEKEGKASTCTSQIETPLQKGKIQSHARSVGSLHKPN